MNGLLIMEAKAFKTMSEAKHTKESFSEMPMNNPEIHYFTKILSFLLGYSYSVMKSY